MADFYGSPWQDVGDATASTLGSMPSAFLRMQLLRQQIGEAQARQRLYGAETEYQRARTASEEALHKQSVDDAIRQATSNEAFGNAMRRLMANSPAAPGPSVEAARNLQLGDIGASIPGISTASNPAQLADMVRTLGTLSSSGALGDPTRALMLEGRKDPFVSGTGGWANVLTGQTGLIPQGPLDSVSAALKQSQIDLNKARTKAAGQEKSTDRTVAEVFLRGYTEDYKLNEDQDKAEEAGSKAVEAFLKMIAKGPQDGEQGTNAPPTGATATPPAAKQSLSPDQARDFLRKAGGDKDKARQMARDAGYSF